MSSIKDILFGNEAEAEETGAKTAETTDDAASDEVTTDMLIVDIIYAYIDPRIKAKYTRTQG